MRLHRLLLPCLAALTFSFARAEEDSVVVFNELNYHPDATGAEWVELRNLMGVQVDLSGWKLRGGVDYDFPDGAVIAGHGYMVVAAVPAHASLAGVGAVGPFSGALNNGGEVLRIENKEGRVMDRLEYGDSGDWPVGADGSGVTLSKRQQGSGDSGAGNWVASAEIGGTPGKVNFLLPGEPLQVSTISDFASVWKYDATNVVPPANWATTAFDDSAWSSGASLLYAGTANPTGGGLGLVGYWPLEETAGTTAPNTVAGGPAGTLFNGPAWIVDGTRGKVLSFDGTNDYVDAGSTTVAQMTLSNNFTWSFWANTDQGPNTSVMLGNRFMPAGGDWSPREFIKFTNNSFEFHRNGGGEDVDYADPAIGTWLHHVLVKSGSTLTYYRNGTATNSRTITQGLVNPQPLYFGSDKGAEPWLGKLDDVAVWNRALTAAEVGSLATGVKNPGNIGAPGTLTTALPLGPTTYYFRRAFDYYGVPGATTLTLRTLIDDGAVIYLNGQEVQRVNMPGGAIAHGTPASGPIGDAAVSVAVTIPSTALVRGANVIAVEVHNQAAGPDPDMVFGLSLTATEQPAPVPTGATGLTLNEISAGSDANFSVELANLGGTPLDLTGYVVASSAGQTFTLGAQTLNAGGFLTLTAVQLGFTPTSADRLFVYTPGKAALVDAQQVASALRGRSTGGEWGYPTAASFGAVNAFTTSTAIVINEIMYHPRPTTPGVESDEQWVELHNRSASAVDLSGWQLTGGIGYTFLPGASLGAGQYLVVARNAAALQAKYPATAVATGDWSGSLSGSGERIRLADAAGNTVNEVHYYDSGRWPENADGFGPSIELRDPDADNTKGEAWAASDEGPKSTWQNVSYTGVAASLNGDPTQWNEFVFGLLDGGEFLIDDISVIEVSVGSRQCIQNMNFSGGATTYRCLGTHSRFEVIADPTLPGNNVLHVTASGASEHMHNHVETTLKPGGAFNPINGASTYTISFRAKWLAGSNQLNSRLYFNRLPRTTALNVPVNCGTPGAANSRLVANAGPTFGGLTHLPVVPAASQSATVSVRASDPDGVTALTLFYSVNGAAFTSTGMTLANGVWSGTVPGQSAAAKVQFYVQATDALGAIATFPAAGVNARAMIPWDDGQAVLAYANARPNNFRIVMTTADATLLHTNTNVMSNDRMPCTVIYNEQEIYYDASVRLKSSQRGRNQSVRVGFNVDFPADHLFLGTHGNAAIDRSGAGNQFSQKEILVKHAVNHAGGIPGMEDDIIRVIAPQTAQTGSALLGRARFNAEWLDNRYANGNDGRLFEFELIYFPMSNVTPGNVETLKLPEPDDVRGVGVSNLGADKELYRWHWLAKNNRDADDYTGLITAVTAIGQPTGGTFHADTKALLDADEWLRTFAVQILFGVGDSYSGGGGHNMYLYLRPTDGKAMYFPWDMDFIFSNGALASILPGGDLSKFLTDSGHKHAYFGHLYDMCQTTFNSTHMLPWAQHYSLFLPTEDLTTWMTFINDRRAYVLGQIDANVAPVAYNITTADGTSSSGAFATIAGTAWVNVRELRVSGATGALDLTWTTASAWQAQVPIVPGLNTIVIQAFGFQGELLGTDTVLINGTGTVLPANATNLVISELIYNPAAPSSAEISAGFTDADAFEFIEVQNISASTINLTGIEFTTGITFTFPTATLAPGARALVVGNTAAFTQRYGSGFTIIGQYQPATGLSNGGERLQLLDAAGQILRDFTYDDSAPWPTSPDGAGYSLVLVAPAANPDHSIASNWRASTAIGGNPGASDATVFTGAANGDDNGDGVVNLLQYALAGTGAVQLPIGGVEGGFLTLHFHRNLAADDVTFIVERSPDMFTWSSAPADVAYVGEAHDAGGTATYTWRSTHPFGETPAEFIRLRVTKP